MKKTVALLAALALAAAPALGRGGEDGWSDLVMPGVLGNVLGAVALGFAGAQIDHSGESLLPRGALLGVMAGSVIGSAVGVHLAAGRRGSLASALLGSLVGEGAALAAAAVLGDAGGLGLVAVIPLLVVPAAGAAICYGRSQGSWQRRAGNGLLNLSDGRLGLGMPDIQVRPILAPGISAKPQMKFYVRLFSAKL